VGPGSPREPPCAEAPAQSFIDAVDDEQDPQLPCDRFVKKEPALVFIIDNWVGHLRGWIDLLPKNDLIQARRDRFSENFRQVCREAHADRGEDQVPALFTAPGPTRFYLLAPMDQKPTLSTTGGCGQNKARRRSLIRKPVIEAI
jgi:hypothetical protein